MANKSFQEVTLLKILATYQMTHCSTHGDS